MYVYIVSPPNHLILREPPIIDLELVQLSLASATSSYIFLKVLLIVDVLFVVLCQWVGSIALYATLASRDVVRL